MEKTAVNLDVKNILVESFKFPVERFVPLLRRCGVAFVLYILLGKVFDYLRYDAARARLLGSEGLIDAELLLKGVLVSLSLALTFLKASMLVGAIQVASAHVDSRRCLVVSRKEAITFLFLLLVGIIGGLIEAWGLQISILAIDFWRERSFEPLHLFNAFLWLGVLWLCAFVAIRLIPIWSSIALENRASMRNAWYVSKPYTWPIIIIGAAYFSVVLAVRLPALVLQYSVVAEIGFSVCGTGNLVLVREQMAELTNDWRWMGYIYLPISWFLLFVGFSILARLGLRLRGSDNPNLEVEGLVQNTQVPDHSAA